MYYWRPSSTLQLNEGRPTAEDEHAKGSESSLCKSQAFIPNGKLMPPFCTTDNCMGERRRDLQTLWSLPIKNPVKKHLSVEKSRHVQDDLPFTLFLKRTEAALLQAFGLRCQ